MTRLHLALAAASLFALPLAPASAAPASPPHLTTQRATCAQVQSLVQSHGVAVLTFGPRATPGPGGLLFGYDYDRVAADARFCLPRQSLTPIWAPTRDNPRCFAGYTCGEAGSRDKW